MACDNHTCGALMTGLHTSTVTNQSFIIGCWYFLKKCTVGAYSSSLLHAIIPRNHLPFFKIFSNFVHFCPNFQNFPPFLPFLNIFLPFFALFLKNRTHALLSRIGPDCIKLPVQTKNSLYICCRYNSVVVFALPIRWWFNILVILLCVGS